MAGHDGISRRARHSVERFAISAISGSVGYRLLGDLDASVLPELRRILRTDLTDGKHVVLDMSSVTFMSSPVLAVLLGARRLAAAFGTSLRLQAPSAACTRLLSIAGVQGTFDIDDALDIDGSSVILSPPGPVGGLNAPRA